MTDLEHHSRLSHTLQSAVVAAVTAGEQTDPVLAVLSRRVLPDIAAGLSFRSDTTTFERGTVPENPPEWDGDDGSVDSWTEGGSNVLAIAGRSGGTLVLYGTPESSVDEAVLTDSVTLLSRAVSEPTTESRLEAQRRNFMKLHSVAAQMVNSQSEVGIFQLAIDAAQSVLDFDFCRIDTIDESGELVPEMTTDGLPEGTPRLDPEAGFTRYVLEEKRQLVVDDIEKYDFSLQFGPYRSAIGVPIEDVGMFVAAAERPDAFDTYDADIADLLMAYVGQTLSSIRSKAALTESKDRLETQTERLELLNRVLRHDVRNDMQMVLGATGMLRDHVEESGETHVETIRENADHVIELTTAMRGLMDDLLADEAALEPVAIDSTIRESVSDVRGTYDSAEVAIDGSVPETTVRADSMLQSVFRNLITNGLTHNTSDTPAVRISATEADGRVVVDVSDNGAGIPEDRTEELFAIGEKGDSSSGTGVGLYLVKTLVERYGGSISVRDNDPTGTVFSVELEIATE